MSLSTRSLLLRCIFARINRQIEILFRSFFLLEILSNKTINHAITNQNQKHGKKTKDNHKSNTINIDFIYEKNLQDEDRGNNTLEINVVMNNHQISQQK